MRRDGEEKEKITPDEVVFIITSATLWGSNFYTDNPSFALSVLQAKFPSVSHGGVY